MKHYWILASIKVEAMSLRERAMLFAIAALLLAFVVNALLLDPLMVRQKAISARLAQQQHETAALQEAIGTILQAKHEDEHSPLRARIAELKAQIQESEHFLKTRRDSLVEPGKMADVLEQVLRSNDKLQLVELKTLPLSLLVEAKPDAKSARPIYKHGVQITVRGSYPELLKYLDSLEKLPTQMFWGELSFSVAKYPEAVLTLTVYTLSLDKTWLTV